MSIDSATATVLLAGIFVFGVVVVTCVALGYRLRTRVQGPQHFAELDADPPTTDAARRERR